MDQTWTPAPCSPPTKMDQVKPWRVSIDKSRIDHNDYVVADESLAFSIEPFAFAIKHSMQVCARVGAASFQQETRSKVNHVTRDQVIVPIG
jgi:hypothetical protein